MIDTLKIRFPLLGLEHEIRNLDLTNLSNCMIIIFMFMTMTLTAVEHGRTRVKNQYLPSINIIKIPFLSQTSKFLSHLERTNDFES